MIDGGIDGVWYTTRFYRVIHNLAKSIDGEQDDWRQPRAFAHTKIAAALLKTWEAVKETEPRYGEGALRVLAWALTLQNFNGSFKGHYNPVRGQTSDDKFMAGLLDGVEGFFSAYVQLLRHPRDIALHPVYLEACRNFAVWLKRLAWSLKGGIPEWVFGDDSLDEPALLPTAKAIRLWLRLHLVNGEPGCLEAAKAAGSFLLKVQDRRDDPPPRGRISCGGPLGPTVDPLRAGDGRGHPCPARAFGCSHESSNGPRSGPTSLRGFRSPPLTPARRDPTLVPPRKETEMPPLGAKCPIFSRLLVSGCY